MWDQAAGAHVVDQVAGTQATDQFKWQELR